MPDTMKVSTHTFYGTAKCNLFLPGMEKPVRDENGALVADPTKTKVIVETDGVVTEYTVNKENARNLPKAGGQVMIVWKTVEGFNEGEAFAYSVNAQ